MSPLLKNLLGQASRDRELSEEMRAVLDEIVQERQRFEQLLDSAASTTDRLREIDEPMSRASGVAEALSERLAQLEQRLEAAAQIALRFQELDDRAQALVQNQDRTANEVAAALSDTQQMRAAFDDFARRIDLAAGLKDRLESFLEIEKPFQELRGEADSIRNQIANTGEHLGRLRDQHERLMDAHKLALSKMEALDRRRDELGRSMTDKERRVASVEQAVQGMDGIQNTVEEVRRDINTVRALGDSVIQKTAALEAQREAVEKALAGAEDLERAMRTLDQAVRQQHENARSLAALQDRVSSLRSLHENVIERSDEITRMQREAAEQTTATRQDLAAMSDEMKSTVERFDFESRGLESVSERVADLRSALTDFENRFKGLAESSHTVAELGSRIQSMSATVQNLGGEVDQV